MASLAQWTWVWAKSERQWRTGKHGKLQSMQSQRVRHDLNTEQQPPLIEYKLHQGIAWHINAKKLLLNKWLKISKLHNTGMLEAMGFKKNKKKQMEELGHGQPAPVFLPGESQGWQSLMGCLPSMESQSWTRLKRLSSTSSSVCITV